MTRAVLRLLLRAYSPTFRERFGEEFVAFALARRAEARGRPLGALRFWAALAADVARTAPAERVEARRTPTPQGPAEDTVVTFVNDLHFAARAMRRRPGFTAVVAATLALGIGATTAVFSVVNAVLLQRLPWPHAERMVAISGQSPEGSDVGMSYPDYLLVRDGAAAFELVGATRNQSVTLAGVERPDRLTGAFATATALRLFGATVAVGRAFTDAESEIATRAPVAVLSHEAWATRFGSDPTIVGRAVRFNGLPFTIVGVTGPNVQTPSGSPDVWLPLPYYPNAGGLERGDRSMFVVGRLRPRATLLAAREQTDAILRRAAAEFPETNRGIGGSVTDLKELIVGGARPSLVVVLAAVATLLLIACLNVANLQLARAVAREREIAVRAALGASASRIVRQLLTESLAMAVLGGALGLALGAVLLRVLVRGAAASLPAFGEIRLDGRALAASVIATLLAGAVAGLLPAWRATRARLGGLGARGSVGRGAMRARRALVVGQTALSVVLLAVAGLLGRSLVALQQVRPGFEASHLLTFQFRLPATKYDSPEKISRMFERTLGELRAIPGVTGAALVRGAPFDQGASRIAAAFDGRPLDDPARALQVDVNIVSDGYFATMGMPLRAGRDLSPRDDARAPMAVVVNEELARRVWPGASPIGRRMKVEEWDDWATVVGVVPAAKQLSLGEPVRPQAYISFRQRPLIFTSALLRTAGEPLAMAEAARRAVWRVDPDQATWRFRDVEQSVASSVGGARALAALTSTFALVALALAAIGVFGVMSFMVAQRRREIGIRLALGARRGQIAGMVVRQGLGLTALALALGLAGAVAAGRALASQLYGVGPRDPLALGGVTALLALVSLLACWLPARRAARVDPRASLQAE
ncbi:MAG: ABC transporter permease [Gemmatimonadaceae bacterium]